MIASTKDFIARPAAALDMNASAAVTAARRHRGRPDLTVRIPQGEMNMNSEMPFVTGEAADFVFQLKFENLPDEALRIAKRCIPDGLGLIMAGSIQDCTRLIKKHALDLWCPDPPFHGCPVSAGHRT